MKKQMIYKVVVQGKDGKTRTWEEALKPHLGLGNQSDLYLSLKRDKFWVRVEMPVLLRVEEYNE